MRLRRIFPWGHLIRGSGQPNGLQMVKARLNRPWLRSTENEAKLPREIQSKRPVENIGNEEARCWRAPRAYLR